MGLLEVVPEDLLVLRRALAVDAVGPLDELLVEGRPGALEDPLVGRVADEDVVEPERLLLERAGEVRAHELLLDQRAEALAHAVPSALGQEMRHGVPDEDLADDRGRFDHGSLVGLQVVEARREQRVDRRRHDGASDVGGRVPASALEADEPLVDEHRDELLDEERVPLGGFHDARPNALVQAGPAEQVLRDGARVVLGETFELDARRAGRGGPLGMRLEELVSSRADHEQGGVVGRLEDVPDQIEEARLGPVDVLEQDDERSRPGERLQQLPCPPDQLLAGELGGREADRRRDAVLRVGVAREGRELLERDLGRVALEDAGRLPDCLGERPEGDAFAVRQAPPAEEGDVVERADELLDESRLPDARLADHGHEAAAPLLAGFVEPVVQRRELELPADDRCVQSSWALGSLADRDEPVCRHGLRLALELERLHLLDVHEVADEAVREMSQEHLLLARGLLETGGDVDRVPRHEPLPARRVPGHDLARVHARSDREPDAPVALELVVQLHLRALHVRGGTHGAEGVVLVELRQAEDGHDRVADELLDDAAVALELGAHRVEVARHDLPERLRVELLAHARRALEVREDDRHGLPKLLWRRPRPQAAIRMRDRTSRCRGCRFRSWSRRARDEFAQIAGARWAAAPA